MADFDNGRPPVSTDKGVIENVSISNSEAMRTEMHSIQNVSVSGSEAQSNQVPVISAVSISTNQYGKIYGGFL